MNVKTTPPGLGKAAIMRACRVLVVLAAAALVASACGSSADVQPVTAPGITTGSAAAQGVPEEAAAAPVAPAAQPAQTEPTAVAPEVLPEPTEIAVQAVDTVVDVGAAQGDDSDEPSLAQGAVDARPVIASAEGTQKFPNLWIHSLQREGDVLRLDFTVSVRAPEPGESYYVRKTFSSIEDSELTGASSNSLQAATFSGISLIDSVNNNRHLVLRDTEGECLCTAFPDFFIGSDFVKDFETSGAALFPAPPQGVTSMTVLFPVFGSFELDIENS